MPRQALEWKNVDVDKLPPKVKKAYNAFRQAEQTLKDEFTASQKHRLTDGQSCIFSFRRGFAVAQATAASGHGEYEFG